MFTLLLCSAQRGVTARFGRKYLALCATRSVSFVNHFCTHEINAAWRTICDAGRASRGASLHRCGRTVMREFGETALSRGTHGSHLSSAGALSKKQNGHPEAKGGKKGVAPGADRGPPVFKREQQIDQIENTSCTGIGGKRTSNKDHAYVDVGVMVAGKLAGLGKRTYTDGRTLEGSFKEGRIHTGKGVAVHRGGVTDEGEWVDGILKGKRSYPGGHEVEGEFKGHFVLNGRGRRVAEDGSVFEGEWTDGDFIGRMRHSDGHCLEGYFQKGRIHAGHGVLVRRNGWVEEGQWIGGIFTGKRTYPDGVESVGSFAASQQGKMQYRKDRTQEGVFRAGHVRHGQGVVKHPNGNVDRGRWVEGNFKGRRTYPDGRTLKGEWREGKFCNGKGVLVRHDGSFDVGTWVKGDLQGRHVNPDGSACTGLFQDGKVYTGKGIVQHPTGDVDEGEWMEGNLLGTRAYVDGTRKSGHFVAGLLQGQGSIQYANGRTLEGEFRQGKIYTGKGVWNHPNGNVDEGDWVEGNLTGKRTYPNGQTREGEWKEGKFQSRSGRDPRNKEGTPTVIAA